VQDAVVAPIAFAPMPVKTLEKWETRLQVLEAFKVVFMNR
jgi:hypothetical protein